MGLANLSGPSGGNVVMHAVGLFEDGKMSSRVQPFLGPEKKTVERAA